jgi:hypothetical protein
MGLLQQLTAATNQYDPSLRDQSWAAGPHLHGSLTYWRGPDPTYGYLYVWGEKDFLRLFRFNTTTSRFEESPSRVGLVRALREPMPGGIISVSSYGNTSGTGIVWATLPTSQNAVPGTNALPGRLYAFNAETLQPLWDTAFPTLGKWLLPTIADGKVFIGTSSNELIVYELGPIPETPRPDRTWQPYQPMETGRASKIPLEERFPDAESMRVLPAIAFIQLAPPRGYVKTLALQGEGEQLYELTGDTDKYGKLNWENKGSIAKLFEVSSGETFNQKGQSQELVRLLPGSTWSAADGSTIVGELQKTFPAPEQTEMPWLLFKIIKASGKGILSDVIYVQCVFTEGGQPPSVANARKGAVGRVPYRAQYIFYSAR